MSTSRPARADEIALLKKIATGDENALADFYNRYIDAVYRFVYLQVGGHRQDAEDVTQETFIAAIDNLKSFRGESRLYVWLCGIAWRKASTLRRRRNNAKTPLLTTENEMRDELDITADQLTVEEVVERQVLRHQVWQALLTLPRHYREVLVLKYLEGFKVAEIALLVGKTEKAVESLLTRARDAFRTQLDHEMTSSDTVHGRD
ncbi:MAG: RNA polymerase sigma factor [Anaerolineae bacterium]